MNAHQKAVLVKIRPDETHGLDELNVALGRGWHVVHATAMGGAGVGTQDGLPDLCLAALVVIERGSDAVLAPLVAEEEPEDHANDIVEGNGAGVELDDDLAEGP